MDGDTPSIKDPARAAARPGFTLVEIVVTLALGVLIIVTVAITTVRFVQERELHVVAQTLVSYLRTAAVRAKHNEGNISQGVSRADGRLTLFRGTSYALKQTVYDTILSYPDYIKFSGLNEIIFSKQTGLPSASGNFVVTNGYKTETVTVYSTGAISRQ